MAADRRRIGVVTGGGDAPGLNTVIRAVVMAAARRSWETIGILGGFEGLLPPIAQRQLDARQMDALLFRGGTVLGTSNRGRFNARVGRDPPGVMAHDLQDHDPLMALGGA